MDRRRDVDSNMAADRRADPQKQADNTVFQNARARLDVM
jgi:hypothetical protein